MPITSEYCRICLKNSSDFNTRANAFESFSIYKKDDSNVCFADKLEYLTKTNIPRNIPLAKRICKSCSGKLNSTYDLVKQCEKSEAIIQNHIALQEDEVNFKIIETGIYDNNYFHNGNDECPSSSRNHSADDNELLEQIINSPIGKYEFDDDDFNLENEVISLSESASDDSDYVPPTNSRVPKIKIIRNLNQFIENTNLKPETKKIKLIGSRSEIGNNNITAERVSFEPDESKNKIAYLDEKKPDMKISVRMNSVKVIKPRKSIKLVSTSSRPKILNCKEYEEKQKIKEKQTKKNPDLPSSESTLCPICGKIYQTAETMRGHIQWHDNNEECFKCKICSKGFDNPFYLRGHMRIHSKRSPPYRCEMCGKSYFHPNRLRLHIQYFHTKERIKCPHCDVTVKYPSSLKRHLFKHTEIKNYECIDCSKLFRTRSNLNQHMASINHSNNEMTSMIRIKGIVQQYVADSSKPSYIKKKRKSLIRYENDMKIQQEKAALNII